MRSASLVLAVAAALAGDAQPAGAQGDPTAAGVSFRLPGMDAVRVRRGVVYRRGVTRASPVRGAAPAGSLDLAMDVYTPADSSAPPAPVVLLVHGAVVPGAGPPVRTWGAFASWGRLLAAAGLAAVAFDHRGTVADNVAEAGEDVEAAVAHVRRHAAELGLDASRVCVVAFSGGGPAVSPLLRAEPAPVRCVALFYPYLDLEHLRAPTRFRRAASAAQVRALAAHSPREALAAAGARVPPLLVARGARDALPGLNASIARFVQTALAVGAPLELHVHPAGPHGFDVALHDAASRVIVAHAVDFLRRHLTDG